MEHEAFSDDALLAELDEHHKWELLTDDADFDTHYLTLREALSMLDQMNQKGLPVRAISKLDGSVYISEEQLKRLLTHLSLSPSLM